ncbi:MAG: hypothetical protein IT306_26005 [Chloroflexi bacterium]|nr:hypothetical protein [Chloroflexota bacterium]
MSIRFKLWLGAMVCAAALLLALSGLTVLLAGPAMAVAPSSLWVTLLLASTLLLTLFAPIAWVLARLAYAPVRDVTRTARRIVVHGQLDGRCFYPGPRDDVGNLVVIMNEVLVRYDAALARIIRLRSAPPACGCPPPNTPPDPADLVLDLEPSAASEATARASAGSPPLSPRGS